MTSLNANKTYSGSIQFCVWRFSALVIITVCNGRRNFVLSTAVLVSLLRSTNHDPNDPLLYAPFDIDASYLIFMVG